MLHIPILRFGKPYESVEKTSLVHHATGEPVAEMSIANSGMIGRDARLVEDDRLESFTVDQLMASSRDAAAHFLSSTLPLGDAEQTFDDYVGQLSATTGMPIGYCRRNAEKIHRVLYEIEGVIGGLTRGFDLSILDRGYGEADGRTLSFYREGRIFGAVLPSNSPGVHSLWIPAIALKTPILLKPGREEPWSPYRIIEAFAAAGVPREVFGFYPTDHAGAGELLRVVDRSMLFGAGATTRPYENDPTVELHGPGYSKVVLGEDTVDDWSRYVDVIASSILANAGRSCINASGVWVPRHGREIAEALAARMADVRAYPADDSRAEVAAFANPAMAESISATIDNDLRVEGAEDLVESIRGSGRLVREGRCAWLLPSIVHCGKRDHPLANREFLFPYASVVECPVDELPEAIGPTLIVSAITGDQPFRTALMNASNIDRLNLGAIPTWQISWDQPHEGNLFEHLYRQRSFQLAAVS